MCQVIMSLKNKSYAAVAIMIGIPPSFDNIRPDNPHTAHWGG